MLPADPMPDGGSLVELMDTIYLEEVLFFNWRLEFSKMRQRTRPGRGRRWSSSLSCWWRGARG